MNRIKLFITVLLFLYYLFHAEEKKKQHRKIQHLNFPSQN